MSKVKRLSCRVGRSFVTTRDGQRVSVKVIAYYPDRKIVRIRYSGGRYQKCHGDFPYYTNAHGVEYFDWDGTRFYADGQVWGRGRINA